MGCGAEQVGPPALHTAHPSALQCTLSIACPSHSIRCICGMLTLSIARCTAQYALRPTAIRTLHNAPVHLPSSLNTVRCAQDGGGCRIASNGSEIWIRSVLVSAFQ